MSGWPSAMRGIGLAVAAVLDALAAADWAATGVPLIRASDAAAIDTAAISRDARYAFFMSNILRYLFASGSLPLGPIMNERPSARMISRAAPSFLFMSRALHPRVVAIDPTLNTLGFT